MSDVLTIGEVAGRSGVATSALRFYGEQGLIHAERNGFRPPSVPVTR
jgi:MerR family redox-sensitive transcriptional activator SoxR